MVNCVIDYRLADGQSLIEIEDKLMSLVEDDQLHSRIIAEEIDRRRKSA